MKRWTLLLLLTALTLVAAACGSDTTTTTTSGSAGDDSATAANDGTADMSDDSMEHEGDDMDDDEGHDDHDDDEDHGDDHDGEHDLSMPRDVAEGDPIPGVSIEVSDELILTVELENFTITPEAVDGESIANEGHMHLLVDGVKVDRFYELERDLTEILSPGNHAVEVELNGNDHRPWGVDGTRIADVVMVGVAGEETADVVISASYADGTLTTDDDRVEVLLGSEVLIEVDSDVDEEVHLHGFDVIAEVGPSTAGLIRFEADVPGTFEVELEKSGTFIVELVVSP